MILPISHLLYSIRVWYLVRTNISYDLGYLVLCELFGLRLNCHLTHTCLFYSVRFACFCYLCMFWHIFWAPCRCFSVLILDAHDCIPPGCYRRLLVVVYVCNLLVCTVLTLSLFLIWSASKHICRRETEKTWILKPFLFEIMDKTRLFALTWITSQPTPFSCELFYSLGLSIGLFLLQSCCPRSLEH